jgi:AcrR family transcriptional regulator
MVTTNLSKSSSESGLPEARRRRPRGEPRRLLLAAAADVFNRKGYATASTREIAELADVSETLIFRYFRNKAGLFREAMVQPFIDVIDSEMERMRSRAPQTALTRDDTRVFVAAMYDVFRENRALAAMVFAADALVESELAESGAIDDVRAAIDRFVTYASEEARAQGKAIRPAAHDLAIRGHMAMVAGVATFGPWYLGKRRPSRKAIIDEMTEWVYIRYNPPT